MALVREGGLSAATVEAITDRAGVSRRTFFNYFASKEDAVLGTTPPSVPEEELSRFLDEESDADQFTRTIRLIVAIIRTTMQAGGAPGERRELVARFPELRDRLSQHVSTAEGLIEAVLAERLSGSGPAQSRSAESSRALLMIASAVLRFAYTRDPGAVDAASPDAIESAISVFRAALKEIL